MPAIKRDHINPEGAKMLRIPRICELYDMTVDRVYRLIKDGKLVAVKDGNATWITTESIRVWLEECQAAGRALSNEGEAA